MILLDTDLCTDFFQGYAKLDLLLSEQAEIEYASNPIRRMRMRINQSRTPSSDGKADWLKTSHSTTPRSSTWPMTQIHQADLGSEFL